MNPIGPVNALYPMPTTLVGATVNGKPNFLTIAHVGILNHGTPQYLSIGLGKVHYSNAGIFENLSFSICLPSEELMVKTDYCGIMTGKKTDKAALFDIFFGKLVFKPFRTTNAGGVIMKKLLVLTILLILIISGCANSSSSRSSDSKMMAAYQELLTKEEVKQVVNQLFISTDNRDWNTVSRLFAPEVLFDMTSMVGGDPVTLTPQQIVASWEKGLAPLKAIHHQAGNFIVQTMENEAAVFCYGIASHYLPNKTNQNTRIFVGSYDFHLIKNDGNWQIDKFKFILKYIDGNPNLESS